MKLKFNNDRFGQRPRARIVLAGFIMLITAGISHAAQYYVAKNGNDGASGSISSPWLTVSKAVSVASAGDTVYFRNGVWNERLITARSGTVGNPITFRNYPGETPVLDATAIPFSGDPGVIEIFNNRQNIVIDGFEVRNLITKYTSKVPIGIKVVGESGTSPKNISILNCNVHSIRNTESSDGANAHGVIVRGESTDPIRNIIISGNKVHDCILGQSEALVVNGNVDGFEITNNEVYNNNNIGIDVIGYEGGISPSLDYARNGLVADNLVYNCTSSSNPAYDNEYSAGGIYIDGGANIIVERNKVYSCDIGIELASEHPNRSTNNITVRSNILWKNNMGGIFTGGYESGLGSTDNCTITNNTLYQNDTIDDWSGEILIRDDTHNLTIKNNILVASALTNVLIQKDSSNTSGIVIDYNLYYAFAGQGDSEWQWKKNGNDGYQTGYSGWKSASGQDAHSIWGLATFNKVSGAVGTYDFCYSYGGLPQDKGDPNFTSAPGETDIGGNSRILGIKVDTGAHEVGLPLTAFESWRQTNFGNSGNVGDGADLNDPDHDGVVNLLEFAVTGGNPKQPDAATNGGALNVSLAADGKRVLTFPRQTAASSLVSYVINGGTGLSGASWTPLAARAAGGDWTSVPGVSVSDANGVVTIEDSRTDVPEHFYSLSVEG